MARANRRTQRHWLTPSCTALHSSIAKARVGKQTHGCKQSNSKKILFHEWLLQKLKCSKFLRDDCISNKILGLCEFPETGKISSKMGMKARIMLYWSYCQSFSFSMHRPIGTGPKPALGRLRFSLLEVPQCPFAIPSKHPSFATLVFPNFFGFRKSDPDRGPVTAVVARRLYSGNSHVRPRL